MKLKLLAAFIAASLTTFAFADNHDHKAHKNHKHAHKAKCGHKEVRHGDHVDYKHGKHKHKEHDGHYDECAEEEGKTEEK